VDKTGIDANSLLLEIGCLSQRLARTKRSGLRRCDQRLHHQPLPGGHLDYFRLEFQQAANTRRTMPQEKNILYGR
jgi:hypothetical protein